MGLLQQSHGPHFLYSPIKYSLYAITEALQVVHSGKILVPSARTLRSLSDSVRLFSDRHGNPILRI